MSERQREPPYKPPLRPHRLIPAPGAVPPDDLPIEAIEKQVESWLAASKEVPTPGLAEGGRPLAEQAWRFIEKAALTLDALPAVLKAANAPEEALQTLELIGSILLALPDQIASGLESSVARVDWMFSRLLNAPAQPGLIEQVIEVLETLGIIGPPDEPPADHSVEIEVLRGLHRDLVTLQLRWDELIEATFPVMSSLPTSPMPAVGSAAPGGSAAARPDQAAPKAPAPLPAGLMIAPTASRRLTGRPFRFYPMSKPQQRLAIVLALALLSILVMGIVLVQSRNTSAIAPSSAALSVERHTPTPTTMTQPTPTIPTPTPTPSPSPTPVPPEPTPTPTPASQAICPDDAEFCVSTLQLDVPCAGDGSVTFKLISNTKNKESWWTFVSRVTISPTHGSLKQGQTVTITVQATTERENSTGQITIFGSFGTDPITITAHIC